MAIKIETAEARLLRALSENAGLGQLCNIVSGVLGNPVALTLPTRTIIAMSDDFTKDNVDDYLFLEFNDVKEECSIGERITDIIKTGKANLSGWPYMRYKRLFCGCLYEKTVVAVVDVQVVSPLPENFDVISFVEAAAATFATALGQNGYFVRNAPDPVQNLLAGLFMGGVNMDYQRRFDHLLVLSQIHAFRIIWVVQTPEGMEPIDERILSFCKERTRCWCVPLPTDNGFAVTFDAAASKDMRTLCDMLQKETLLCIGNEFSKLRDAAEELVAVKETSNIAWAQGISLGVVRSDDYKILLTLERARNNRFLDGFSNEVLDKIRKYDETYSSFYMETLRTYFQCNKDYVVMATVLRIHRNTVFYRMNKLKDIFEIDLSDFRQMANLFYAIMIYDNVI